jgi:hypothetical protein
MAFSKRVDELFMASRQEIETETIPKFTPLLDADHRNWA